MHYIQECDEIIILEEGEIAAAGTVKSIHDKLIELVHVLKPNEENEEDEEEMVISEIRSTDSESSPSPKNES